ncbi:MAG: hypothetical protein ABI042_17935 [Verrucomicrobiota bacterium]
MKKGSDMSSRNPPSPDRADAVLGCMMTHNSGYHCTAVPVRRSRDWIGGRQSRVNVEALF